MTDYHHQVFVFLFTENSKRSIKLSVMKEICRASAFNLVVTKLISVQSAKWTKTLTFTDFK